MKSLFHFWLPAFSVFTLIRHNLRNIFPFCDFFVCVEEGWDSKKTTLQLQKPCQSVPFRKFVPAGQFQPNLREKEVSA